MAQDGWLLVGLIVLISGVILALAGASFLISGQLRVASVRQNQAKTVALADAGVMQAIYDFRFNDPAVGGTDNGFRLGEYAVPSDTGTIGSFADDDVFILGGQAADFLLVAMIPGTFDTASAGGGCGSRQRLQGWTVRNVLLSADNVTPTPPDGLPDGLPVNVTQMSVNWSPYGGAAEGPIRLDLDGTGADWRSVGCAPIAPNTPIPIPAAQQAVSPNSAWSPNRIWFATANMDTKLWIELTFTMSDGSARRARFLPATPLNSSASFTVKSVGEVRKGVFPFKMWRRVQAEYRLNSADVTNFQLVGSIASDPSPVADRPGYRELNQKQP